jgi:hypothetical protein
LGGGNACDCREKEVSRKRSGRDRRSKDETDLTWKELEKFADKYAEKAEQIANLSLVSKSNAMRSQVMVIKCLLPCLDS